jgi:heterodisulfide reductase subunit A
LAPKLVEVGRHSNIKLHTLTEVKVVKGEPGNFRVKLEHQPRYVDLEKCLACGLCAEKCPYKVPDEFNGRLGLRKAAYIPYPQALPQKYVIDPIACVYFKKGTCKACVKFCPTGAVDLFQRAKEQEIAVGAVILALGFTPFYPDHQYRNYHYASHPNVVTSLEFERILSASGPFAGKLVRPSDSKEPARQPQKIAWLQCVGSRDLRHGDYGYCSAVCCMYAVKQAVIAKEHSQGPLDTAIFYMDMRTHGKEFEKYYWRAKQEHEVRFVRSRVHSLKPVPGTQDLEMRYLREDGTVVTETFDLVVLSVGLEVSPEAVDLAHTLNIDLQPETGFAATSPFTPITSNNPGIFVCGVFSGPKDIPQSVMEASAAAAAASELLASARGTEITTISRPPEVDVTEEEPRVGVFVCRCGSNIAGVIDVPVLVEYAQTLPQVVMATENLFTCSADTQVLVQQAINEHHLNRVVVASCSPRTHARLFMETLVQAGLNPYLMDMANIRNQDTWVHQHEPEAALEKAMDLVRMAVARVANLEPLHPQVFPVNPTALVVGGGVAGMEAALSLANMGFPTYLVEKTDCLGGNARNLVINARGYSYPDYLQNLIESVTNHDKIEVLFNTTVQETTGFIGNFQSTVAHPGGLRQLEHGVVILATGGHGLAPEEYLYGEHPNVILPLELDKAIAGGDPRVLEAQQVVFIQCVGSREPERPYCSRLCCTHSIESALALKELKPEMEVFILYRDMRTYGDKELLYQEAREKGVCFIRYDLDRKPQVGKTSSGGLTVTVFDPILGLPLTLQPDLLTLASAILPNPTDDLGEIFKVPRTAEGFFNEAHAKLRPVDCVIDGIYLAGLAHYPKPLEESVAQAKAAAVRAATVLSQEEVEVEPTVATVDQNLCIGCGFCELSCPYHAIHLIQVTGKGLRAENLPAYCKGCGICAAGCPQRAIDMMHFRDRQVLAVIHAGGRLNYLATEGRWA